MHSVDTEVEGRPDDKTPHSTGEPLSLHRPSLGARRHTAIVLLVGLAVCAVARTSHADRWYEHYDRAEAALAAGDWSQAAAELNEALQRRGDSGARVRSYGMKVVAYFPYLKLGIAYLHLGRFDAALQAFDTEERLGAIADSPPDLATLRDYRQRATTARDRQASEAETRVPEIVETALAEASMLEEQGQTKAAMESLSRALAVDPDNADVVARMEALRSKVVALEQQQRLEKRIQSLVASGRQALDTGDPDRASSLLREALDLRSDPVVDQLLRQAQDAVRSRLQSTRDANEVTQILETVDRLTAEGRTSDALTRLEAALAVAPDDPAVQERLQRLHATRRAADLEGWIADTLTNARAELEGGRWERAIASVNRILDRDRSNQQAHELLQRAYRELGRTVLGSQPSANLPPAIRFADYRTDQPDGSRTETVDHPDFRLSGVVIDTSPVRLEVTDQTGRPLTVSHNVQVVGDSYLTDFRIDLTLQSAATTVAVNATDSAGLSSRSEYAVAYRRPVTRTAWFRALAAGLPLATALLIVAFRLNRRHRLRTRRFNPFIAGAPVLDRDLFFGRDRLVDRILQTVHNNSLLLYGERRIGKTSLQHHLKRRLESLDDPDYAFHPVYVDLQGTPEERFFATLAEDVFGELAAELGDLRPSPEIAVAGSYGYRELVKDLTNVLRALASRTSKQVKLVLLIDEVDELNDYDPRINQRLRSLFMKSFADHLVAVVSGVRIRREWEREASPWYNFFEEIEVTPLERDDAEALITQPMEGMFRFSAAAIDRILDRTGCRPYQIQKLCMALVNRLHEEGRRTITVADVESIVQDERP